MRILFTAVLSVLFASVYAQGGPAVSSNKLLSMDLWKEKPSVETIQKLIQEGNNPSEKNASAFDPVVMAINSSAPTETILFLLAQKGNNIDKETHDGRQYLHWAASAGNTDIIKYLLSKGAKPSVLDSKGSSPLNFAASASQKNLEVYNLLIKAGVNLKKELSTEGANALLLAVGNDVDLSITDFFIKQGLSLNSVDHDGNTAFDYAARGGNVDVMKKLLARGVKFTNNAIILASQGGRRGFNKLPVYEYLVSVGVQPAFVNKTGTNVLHNLVRRGNQLEEIKYFLSKGAKLNIADNKGNTPLMYATASMPDQEVIDFLLTQNIDVNHKNKEGVTALMNAFKTSSAKTVQSLLSLNADLNQVDAKGNNMAYYIVEGYNPRSETVFNEKLQILKDKNFNFAALQAEGNTIYHLAVAKNDVNLLKAISNLNADINVVNKEGLTALHRAAMLSKDTKTLEYLVSMGAKKDVKTGFDETAFDLAKENEFLNKQSKLEFLK